MKSSAVFFLIFLSVFSSCKISVNNTLNIDEGFIHPHDSLNPWCYYYWVADNVTAEGISKDLESMAEMGIGTAFIGNIGTVNQYQGEVKMLSPEWFDLTVHAVKEAQRVGVDLGMFNSPGWSQSGGPWNKAENSMRYLSSSEKRITGPVNFNGKLEKPSHHLTNSFHYNLDVESAEDTVYEDVKVLAFQVPDEDDELIQDHNPVIEARHLENAAMMFDKNRSSRSLAKGLNIKTDSLQIDISTDTPFTARSLSIYPAPSPVQAVFHIYAEMNGNLKLLRSFEMDRSNAMISVGFKPYAPVCISLPEVTSKQFRIVGKNLKFENMGISEIELSGAARLESFQEKQLAKMFQTPLPRWKDYKWGLQEEFDNQALYLKSDKVLDISSFMDDEGVLNWQVPEGEWVIMRVGMYPTGTKNTPSSKEATGLEVDKMSREHVRHHFGSYLKMFIDSIAPDDRKAFKYVIADSYEQGSQNWTDNMQEFFLEKYGYDPLPFLPVLSGRIVESAEISNRFLWDLRRLIADKIAYEYVGGLKEISNEYGLEVWLENYGHWGFPAEFLQYGGQSDHVGGEFWAEGELGSIECKAASSCAHIYGKNSVFAESYTSGSQAFQRHPGILKKRGDWSFTKGINHTVLTLFIHQPYENRFPGMAEWYGSEINRLNTWYSQADSWIEYLKRCHYMLKQGEYVADICYFIGEDAPVMTGIQEPELPAGYSFDFINAEALMKAEVEKGKITLPGGMSYRLLVLPPLKTMTPELLQKIADLVRAGAKLYGEAPLRSPGLKNYPVCDEKVQKLSMKLWKNKDWKSRVGKGFVYQNSRLQEVFDDMHLVPDFELTGDEVLWTHRKHRGGDIYFLTNQTDKRIEVKPGFRVTGRQPELWDATNGDIRNLYEFSVEGRKTWVPLVLEPKQSFFLVFRKEIFDGEGLNFPQALRKDTIRSAWKVQFDPLYEGPEEAVSFRNLMDWKNSDDKRIRYYSGTAAYLTYFDVEKIPDAESVFINLGSVGVMAKVKLNGAELGGVWTPPYRLEVGDVLKKGRNKLEIEVVNLWMNKLIEDKSRPVEKRLTWLSLGHESIPDGLELFSSGLLGPVCIEYFNYDK